MSLEDDIARVRRLRGQPATVEEAVAQGYEVLQVRNADDVARARRDQVKRAIYVEVGLPYELAGFESSVYEALPPASRKFLQDAPFDIAPSAFAQAFSALGDERAAMVLIEEIFREHRAAGRIEDCTTLMMAEEARASGRGFRLPRELRRGRAPAPVDKGVLHARRLAAGLLRPSAPADAP